MAHSDLWQSVKCQIGLDYKGQVRGRRVERADNRREFWRPRADFALADDFVDHFLRNSFLANS